MQFLRDLRKYIEIHELEVQEIFALISQCLQGIALKWWTLTENSINSLDEFTTVFKARFWNSAIQKTYRMKIEFHHYESTANQSRTEYAMEIFSLAQDLDTPYTEQDLIDSITSHYDKEVRGAIKGRGIHYKEGLFALLDEFDNDTTKRKLWQQKFNTNNANNNPRNN